MLFGSKFGPVSQHTHDTRKETHGVVRAREATSAWNPRDRSVCDWVFVSSFSSLVSCGWLPLSTSSIRASPLPSALPVSLPPSQIPRPGLPWRTSSPTTRSPSSRRPSASSTRTGMVRFASPLFLFVSPGRGSDLCVVVLQARCLRAALPSVSLL